MKNLQIANEKQLVKGIVSAFNKLESAKKGYVYSVIDLGEKLLEAKKKVPFGQWESWLKVNSELPFGHEQATKYMKVAANKLLVLEYFSDENSVNQLTKAIADATPEQLERAEKLKLELEEKARIAEEEKQRKAAELEAKRQEEEILKHVEVKQPEIIEGEFTEVKSQSGGTNPCHEEEPAKPDIDENPVDYMQSIIDELNEQLQEVLADNESMAKVFDANDQLAEALAELKKAKETIRVLEDRLRGLQNERNEAIRTAKMWRSKFEKLEKAAE